ncbi:flagellar hook assembly protein FlgD [Heyndrickxia acidicola]|uniref:Basal-body rod modification protein FlgD n=1 Tax=Heyndrickxia acidicola TaxID=209389 RepID=A0ABU6MC28_9BACI|nr:flagellar hook assembly protein FlgD [Heyndrickxia acidicola]MED1202070.1 flagellar hook assembly protein FlgD [Heyndrickxia acidicola]
MTNTIDSSSLLSSVQQSQSSSSGSSLGKDDFLKILMTQLQNQDPTQPLDDSAFISQMATFSSLEQLTNMNTQLGDFLQQNQLMGYSQLVGKEVSWTKAADSTDSSSTGPLQGTGKITGVEMKDGSAQITLDDGTTIDPTDISDINSNNSDSSLIQASYLIGKKVTWSNGSDSLSGVVQNVSSKNGNIQLTLDNNQIINTGQITQIEQ